MSEGEEHTPVQQVFYRLFRIIGDLFPQHGLSWGEEGSRNILVRHICREGPPGAQGTLCSIILDPRNGIVIKIQRTQFGVDDRELKIKPAWDRELERSRLYVQYPDGEGRFILNDDDLEEVALYLLGALP